MSPLEADAADGVVTVELLSILDVGDILSMWWSNDQVLQVQVIVKVRVAASEPLAPQLLVNDEFDVRAVIVGYETPMVGLRLPAPHCLVVSPLADVDPGKLVATRLAREGVPGWVVCSDEGDGSTSAT